MKRLFSRALVRRSALPVLAALAGSLLTPIPALAAGDPRPFGGPAAAALPDPGSVTYTDLGSLGTIPILELNLGGKVNKKGEGATAISGQAVTLAADRPLKDINGRLGADVTGSRALDVNDYGTVVGTYTAYSKGEKHTGSFIYSDKAGAKLLEGRSGATAINNLGQVAGGSWVYDPSDDSFLDLRAYKGQSVSVRGMNNFGATVGIADESPVPAAFRSRPGQRLDMARDHLEYPGGSTMAMDINDRGEVAGYARVGGTDTPVYWDSKGTPYTIPTRRGGIAYAINNSSVVGGMMYGDGPGGSVESLWRAAVWFPDGTAINLNDLVPAEQRNGLTLRQVTGISDQGVVFGNSMALDGSERVHAFMLDLHLGEPTIDSVRLLTQLPPSTAFVPVPDRGVYEGNRVRVNLQVTNPTSQRLNRTLQVVEEGTGKPLPNGTFPLTLKPNETVERTLVWDTKGYAWLDGKPHSDRSLSIRLFSGTGYVEGVDTKERAPIKILPMPLVLVHGFTSTADTWSAFGTFAKQQHPAQEVYAVGDGRWPGTMNTGDRRHPEKRTKSLLENADEVNIYTQHMREGLGADKFRLVAHSMGGNISKEYILSRMPDGVDGKPVVDRLLQMGTPNMGSACADALLGNGLSKYWWSPALRHNGTAYVAGLNKLLQLAGYSRGVVKGVPISNLVGLGRRLRCPTKDWIWHGDDTDGVVESTSAFWDLLDTPTTRSEHSEMVANQKDYAGYIAPRLMQGGSTSSGIPGGTPLAPEGAPHKRLAGAANESGTTGTAGVSAAAAEGGGGGEASSLFAFPSAMVEAGKTVSVPLEVPQGTAFGVVTALPPTAGVLLRDPSGNPAASSAAGGDDAKEPIQALDVDKPQAGIWRLEFSNTGSEPIQAWGSAWIAGTAVNVTATAEQSSEEGRVTVSATVTDGGDPVSGATVRATLTGEDGADHELTLTDEGAGAAGDGVYGGTTEALADGVYTAVITADTAKGMRATTAGVEVRQVDTREFPLTLSAQSGGSVAASPARDSYRAGTTVKVTATPDAGRVLIGWVIDGQERGPGPLTVTMDKAHTVEARFGTYQVTEIGTLPGGDVTKTDAWSLNDRGQVAATVTGKDGRQHAVRWQDGTFTELGGPPCTDGTLTCETGAVGIDEAGNASGWAVATTRGYNSQHAVTWRSDGSVTDLQPNDTAAAALAETLNDNGQAFGATGWHRYVMWDRGAMLPVPEYDTGFNYQGEAAQVNISRINGSGEVAGAYALGRNSQNEPTETVPAVYADGVLTKLPMGAVEGCAGTGGRANDLNDTGLVVGTVRCGYTESTTTKRAYVWKDGKPTDLGAGEAIAVNDNDLIVGLEQEPRRNGMRSPVMWVDGTAYPLKDLLSRPWCPEDGRKTTVPCMGMAGSWSVRDVNSSGQMLVAGFVREPAPAEDGGFHQENRMFLLTPTTAQADLKVEQTVTPAEPGPGSTVIWTTTVTNRGPDTATDVQVDVYVPKELAGVAVCEPWRGRCAPIKGGFRTKINKLEPGWDAVVEVSAKIPATTADGTALTAKAWAVPLEVRDPKTDDNGASATATVRPLLNTPGVVWQDPVKIGTTSYPVTVTLTNRLDAPIPLKAIAVEGPFAQSNACPVELAVGDKCVVTVTFSPTAEGAASGKLTFSTADGAAPAYTVTLAGTGVAAVNSRPVIKVPSAPLRGVAGTEFTLEAEFTDADVNDTHTAKVTFGGAEPEPATVKQQAGGGTVTATRTFTAPVNGMALVIVSDGKETTMQGIPYVIEAAPANTAPVVTAGPDAEVTVGEKLQRSVSFTDADSASWSATVDYGDGSGAQPVTPGADKRIGLEHQWGTAGTYTVTVKVKDDGGLEGTARFTVTVKTAETPNQPPKVTLRTGFDTVEAGSEWIGMGSFTDPDSSSWSYTADYGDGAGPQPLTLTAGQLKLVHAYDSAGDYTVVLTVTDDKGGSGSAPLVVHVTDAAPEVALKAPVTAVEVGTPVTLTASFTDRAKGDTHTATWTVGKEQLTGAVTEHDGKGTLAMPHVFTEPGLYPVSVTVADNHGGRTTADAAGGAKAHVLVYARTAALTGAGTLAIPAGACTLTAECAKAGEASVTVTAHYPRKGRTPAGKLRYSAPGFTLDDTSYTVLSTTGATAILRGTGQVKGVGKVSFEVTVLDAGAGDKDRLHLVARDGKGTLVYDNQPAGAPSPMTGVLRVAG